MSVANGNAIRNQEQAAACPRRKATDFCVFCPAVCRRWQRKTRATGFVI